MEAALAQSQAPVSSGPAGPSAPNHDGVERRVSSRGRRKEDGAYCVIFVADSQSLNTVSRVLGERRLEARVEVLEGGLAALRRMGLHRPALQVLDVRSPGVDAPVACRRLVHTLENCSRTVVLTRAFCNSLELDSAGNGPGAAAEADVAPLPSTAPAKAGETTVILEPGAAPSRERADAVLLPAGGLANSLLDTLRQTCPIPADKIDQLLEIHRSAQGSFLGVLRRAGTVELDMVMRLASARLGVEWAREACNHVREDVLELVPEKDARESRIVPIARDADGLVLAMEDPADLDIILDLEGRLGLRIRPVLHTPQELDRALALYRGQGMDLTEILQQLGDEVEEVRVLSGQREPETEKTRIDDEAPIIQLVNHIIAQAVDTGASDIHIEPGESDLRIRFRVDGVLREVLFPPKRVHAAVVSRLKIMADLDIAERRLGQDGRMRVRTRSRDVELRISTIPGIHGEKVVLRLMDKGRMHMDLEDLGFEPEQLAAYTDLLQRPHGVVLVTGPTGSGKTTTLYSTLARLNGKERNIISIEDPVEYELDGVTQIQVNTRAGITFAGGLRSVFRQDPDVIMIGEMRDAETAEIAIRAALTGHQVFSTLHTNDAPGALTRLREMGIPPYLIASSVIGVVAQRLARLVCPDCRESYQPGPQLLAELGLDQERPVSLMRARGCKRCAGSGYVGRSVVLEVMPVGDRVREALMAGSDSPEIRRLAVAGGMRGLWEHGVRKVVQGLTTTEEMFRVMRGGE